MTTGIIAALLASFALAFVEGFGRFYPARQLWLRLRRARGRHAVRVMRERYEAVASRNTPLILAAVLAALIVVQVSTAHSLHRRWYEVVVNVLPSAFIAIAMLRTPSRIRAVAERMKVYERETGDDPDHELPEGEGPTAAVL